MRLQPQSLELRTVLSFRAQQSRDLRSEQRTITQSGDVDGVEADSNWHYLKGTLSLPIAE